MPGGVELGQILVTAAAPVVEQDALGEERVERCAGPLAAALGQLQQAGTIDRVAAERGWDRGVELDEQAREALLDVVLLGEDLLGLSQPEAAQEVAQGALLAAARRGAREHLGRLVPADRHRCRQLNRIGEGTGSLRLRIDKRKGAGAHRFRRRGGFGDDVGGPAGKPGPHLLRAPAHAAAIVAAGEAFAEEPQALVPDGGEVDRPAGDPVEDDRVPQPLAALALEGAAALRHLGDDDPERPPVHRRRDRARHRLRRGIAGREHARVHLLGRRDQAGEAEVGEHLGCASAHPRGLGRRAGPCRSGSTGGAGGGRPQGPPPGMVCDRGGRARPWMNGSWAAPRR